MLLNEHIQTHERTHGHKHAGEGYQAQEPHAHVVRIGVQAGARSQAEYAATLRETCTHSRLQFGLITDGFTRLLYV